MKDYVIAAKSEEYVKYGKKLGFDEIVFLDKRIVKSSEKDRNLIESKRVSMIYEFESLNKKDSLNYRNSGMNHIIAKLMADNDVSYGLSFSMLLNASKEEKPKLFGRIIQNIRLCRKFRVKIVVASFARNPYEMRDSKDLLTFARLLGVSS